MYLSSHNFKHQGLIPPKHTCDDANISPSLVIQGVPPGTQSLAIIMQSLGIYPDTQPKTTKKKSKPPLRIHWLVWNIPPNIGFIPEGETPKGATIGINDFWEHGYGGPYPPTGECHQYRITAYALSTSLNLPSSTSPQKLLETIQNHLLDQDQLIGYYQRH